MAKHPPRGVKPAPLVPDMNQLHCHLWRQFINQPGVFQKLIGHLEDVKKQNGDDIICDDLEFPSSEDDFHPLSESSRISVSDDHSARVSMPPMSPRTPIPSHGVQEEERNVFFVSNNIDLVPDRNITSPVVTDKDTVKVNAIKVPVIKYHPAVEETLTPRDSSPETEELSTDKDVASLSLPLLSKQETLKPTYIPPFYHPHIPIPLLPSTFISSIQTFFSSQPSSLVTPSTAPLLAQALQLSPYLSTSIFTACYGPAAQQGSCSQFLSFWQAQAKLLHCVEDPVKIFNILSGCTRNYLIPDDFLPIISTVLNTHCQLDFFRGESYQNLHTAYLTSVVAAIFFTAGAWRRKRMYFWQFSKLGFHKTLDKLATDQDLNFIEYFSYDQFYVFYVKFVSLDIDEDGVLSQVELLEYEDGGQLARKVVDRVWQVNLDNKERNMEYWDWVIFLMAEVDKSTDPAMDYWFAVLDVDGDGLLSIGEMKVFYTESLMVLITADIVVPQLVKWEDIKTQIWDIIRHTRHGLFSLMDIKGNVKFAHILDAFINIFSFIMNDESDVSIKSEMSLLQKYVVRSLNDLES